MPRPPSISLRLGRVMNAAMERVEADLIKDPNKRLSKQDAETLLVLAKADAIVRGRKPEEGETEEMTGRATEEDAKALVQRLTQGARAAAHDEDDDG